MRCLTKDHQQSSLIPPLVPCLISLPIHCISLLPLPVALLSAPHAVWWKANQVEKEDPDVETKCWASPLVFLHSMPVKLKLYPTHGKTQPVSVRESAIGKRMEMYGLCVADYKSIILINIDSLHSTCSIIYVRMCYSMHRHIWTYFSYLCVCRNECVVYVCLWYCEWGRDE